MIKGCSRKGFCLLAKSFRELFSDVESKRESQRLAEERGAFPEWARSIFGPDETCARDAQGKRIRPMQLH